MIRGAFTIVALLFGLALRFPEFGLFVLCLSVSVGVLIAGISFAGHRGDLEIGVADTQGRGKGDL